MNGTTSNETEISEILSRLNKEQALIMIPSTILVIITMSVGLIGNLLTCYVYGFQLKMTPTYLFVVMLAVVDLMTCAIITPGRIVQNVFPMMITPDVLCKLHMGLSVFTGFCTCGFLLVIAVDRYRRMCRPLKSQLTMKGSKITTLVICAISTGQGSVVTVYYGSVRKPTIYPNVFGQSCSAKITKEINYYQLGFFASYLFIATFTIFLLVGLYSVVLHTMKKIVNKNKTVISQPSSKTENLYKNLNANPTTAFSNVVVTITNSSSANTLKEVGNETEEKTLSVSCFSASGMSSGDSVRPAARNELTKKETRSLRLKRAENNIKRFNRTTVTMMMITAVFVVTYIPSLSAMIVNAVMRAEQKMGTATAIFYWLARHTFYISSCLNPIIYGYRNKNFKDEVRLLFRKFKLKASFNLRSFH